MEHDATINGDSGDTVVMQNPITGGIDLPAMRAAHKFATVKELVIMTGDHLPDRDLGSLCLVNWDFNAMFSQRLYRHIRLNARLLQPGFLTCIAGNQRFRHTRILSLHKAGMSDASEILGYDAGDGLEGTPLPEWVSALVQRTATDILRNSPSLHTICLNSTRIGPDKAVLIVNNGFDGKLRRSSTELQWFSLKLKATPLRELSTSIFQQQSLKCLCLYGIPTASWRMSMLCGILKESPALRYLKLSYLHGEENQWSLEEICKQYSQLGGAPLQLEILMLRKGVYLKLPEQVNGLGASAQASYLALLTDPTYIQEMGIIATRDTAWDTFDSAFFPSMNRFRLSASIRNEDVVGNFLKMCKARDFLSQVHLEVDGALFRNFENFRDMTRKFFEALDPNDPASCLAPMGFSFHSTLQEEGTYRQSAALPLPTTRILDIAIDYNHLINFSWMGLSKMAALERLSLNVYVYRVSQWDDLHIIGQKQLRALNNAAMTCPNLRYARITMGAKGPASAAIADLSRSWEIVRVRSRLLNEVHPVFKALDAEADKLLRTQSMWTSVEKKVQYVKEDLGELAYDKPVWMERAWVGTTEGGREQQ